MQVVTWRKMFKERDRLSLRTSKIFYKSANLSAPRDIELNDGMSHTCAGRQPQGKGSDGRYGGGGRKKRGGPAC